MRKLFYLLLALPLVLAACEPEPTPEPEPEKKAQLILTSDEVMNFKAEGGQGLIDYTLVNAKEGAEFASQCEAEWISDFVFGEDITFVVAANEGEPREAKIVITYAEASMEVTVKQAEKTEAPAAPALVITSENPLEVDHKEQMGTITYTIENPKEGVSVTAKCNANWISQLTVQEANSKVVFMVGANSGDAREAVVTLTYGPLEEKVTVKQSEYVAEAPVINVESKLDVAAEGGAQSLAYSVDNKVEGVELTATCEAEWISNIVVAAEAITFDVAANEDIMREATLVLTYGTVTAEVTITQLPAGADEDMVYSVFQIVDCWASMDNGGAQWDVTFVEHDATLGDMQTRISFALAEPNLQRVADGVYSVENGGILINSASLNGFSSYRTNTSIDTDITVAEFTVATNTETKTISFRGTFQAANNVVTLNYNGEMRGMDLGEAVAGTINHTEWASVVKNWHENKELLFTATSADGTLTAMFDFYDFDNAKSLAEGEYPILDYLDGNGVQHLRKSSKFTYNNVDSELAEGSATVEHISGGYKITYNIIDALGREFTGVIEGPIEGAVNP
ncbi:MAG: BACON domain-containing protein [Alistipes sp.]|nr:BACON domain-containing protein [Alistipes sp.]